MSDGSVGTQTDFDPEFEVLLLRQLHVRHCEHSVDCAVQATGDELVVAAGNSTRTRRNKRESAVHQRRVVPLTDVYGVPAASLDVPRGNTTRRTRGETVSWMSGSVSPGKARQAAAGTTSTSAGGLLSRSFVIRAAETSEALQQLFLKPVLVRDLSLEQLVDLEHRLQRRIDVRRAKAEAMMQQRRRNNPTAGE